jgi:hypothetical protein
MMKIPDLSKIDIKDIDINKIKDQLIEQKELVLQIGLGVVTFFMIISMMGGCQKEISKYKSQINSMQSKSGIIDQYKKSQSDVDTFLKSLPPSLSEDQIIDLVTDLADKNKIKILTFTPTASRNESRKIYQETAIQFSMQADTYKSMVRMIAAIERSKSILQVKNCSVQSVTTTSVEPGPQGERTSSTFLNFRIEVASLEVKQEAK